MAKLSSTDIYGDLYVDGTIRGTISGNATTATTLQTARTINGTSFNGSANITTANWGTARTITIGSTGKSVNGSGNVSWTLAEIGAAAASHGTHLEIGTGAGNAAAGNHTHSYLPLSGGTMTGKITTPNNAQGITIGDDVTLCDRNIADHLVLEGSTATNGGITFGSGKDTNIYRGAANQLKTDDAFYAVGEIISGSNVRSDTALTDNLGTAAIPWKTTCSKQVYLYGEASKRYGYLSTPTVGTTSTVGECLLVLGNETASGTASNATGMIYLYGTNTGGTYLKTAHTGTGTYTITLPAKSGTVACTSDLDSYSKTSHTHNNIVHQDTRAVNTTPDNVPQGLSVHLKSEGTDGLSDGGTYHSSLFIKGWNDHSGGPYGNIAVTANNNLWFRSSSSGTAWNAWKKVSLNGHTHKYAASDSYGGTANSVNGLTFWTGTLSAYNALSSKSNTTVYLITG